MTTSSENKKILPLNLLNKIILHLSSERKKNIKFIFFLSLFSSLAESVSIAMLIPFVSFFINPENYIFNDFLKFFFNFFKY
jgi:hypothetical protein